MAARIDDGFATLEKAADAIAQYLPHRPRPKRLDSLRKNLRLGDDSRFRWRGIPPSCATYRSAPTATARCA